MLTFSHVIEVTVDGKSKGSLQWSGNSEASTVHLTIIGPSGYLGTATWNVDWKAKRIATDVSAFQGAVNGSCLLGCVISAGAALGKCIMNAKTEDDVWKCLDEHAGLAGVGVLACVIGCM